MQTTNNLLIVISLLIFSCASRHKASYAEQVGSKRNNKHKTGLGLVISGEVDTEFSDKYFGLIYVVFENTSDKWIVIKKIQAGFQNPKIDRNAKFIYGRELELYIKSKERVIAIQESESRLAAFVAGAATVATLSQSHNRENIENKAFTASALTSIIVASKTSKKIKRSIFPTGHLLRGDAIIIPPGLFEERWLIVNTQNHQQTGFIDHLYISYRTKKRGIKETVKLNNIRQKTAGRYLDDWQLDLQ